MHNDNPPPPTPPPTPDATPAPPAAVQLSFDLSARMRVVCCTACGVQFTLPLALYLQRADVRGAIHCPSGHANALRPADAQAASMLMMAVANLAEMTQLRHELQQAKTRLAALEPLATNPAPLSDREMLRRVKFLVARAELAGGEIPKYGKRLCRWCGCMKAPPTLRRHFLKEHQPDIRLLPASEFD